MVPASRLGLLPWMVNPLVGYIMVLQTIGRKSGKLRQTPLNYALSDGCIYCMAGFGAGTDWLANVNANPSVEVRLPGTVVRGKAEIVTETDVKERIFIHIIRNCGFASLFVGLNPFTLTDAKILAKRSQEVVVRIHPTEISAGPYDPGSKGWIHSTLPFLVLALMLGWLLFGRKKAVRNK
jgi:deazaflavin-dependent oxidoreductase (nitroreductase family)